MSFSLKYCCWFPVSYRVKHKVIARPSQPNSWLFSVLCCHFLRLALPPPPLTSLILWFIIVPGPLTSILVYWNHVYQGPMERLLPLQKTSGLWIWNQFLLPGVFSNNMAKASFVVWLLGSLFHISLSISSPATLKVREVIFIFASQVPSPATAQGWCRINLDWISFPPVHFCHLDPFVSAFQNWVIVKTQNFKTMSNTSIYS